MSPQLCTMIMETSTFGCDEPDCDEDGYILVLMKRPVMKDTALRRSMTRIGTKCWTHFTPDLMALPEEKL